MSSSSRIAESASQVPLCTLCVTLLCTGLHVCDMLFELPLTDFSLSAANVIYLGEYYRIVSGALLHVDLLHLGFNMMSLLAIGSGLETTLGTLGMGFIILWSIILSGSVHVAISWMMTVWFTHELRYIIQMSRGFSGVVFTLALMECHKSPRPRRSVFGLFQVPTKLYPWVLLILTSMLLHRVSFLGHLSGILVGLLHVYGFTKPLLPSPAFLIEVENTSYVRGRIAERPNFIRCPQPQSGSNEGSQAFGTSTPGLCRCLALRGSTIWRILTLPFGGSAGRTRDRDRDRGGHRLGSSTDGDIEAATRLTSVLV